MGDNQFQHVWTKHYIVKTSIQRTGLTVTLGVSVFKTKTKGMQFHHIVGVFSLNIYPHRSGHTSPSVYKEKKKKIQYSQVKPNLFENKHSNNLFRNGTNIDAEPLKRIKT